MTSIADAYVDLHVDGDRIPGETRESLKRAEGSASKGGDAMGAAAGAAFSKGFSRSATSGLEKAFSTMVGSMGSLAKTSVVFTGITTAAIGLSAGVANLSALLGSLAPAIGSIGILPGLLGGAVGVFSAVAVGASGLGEALKNMGDPEKFAESLKSLAPSAAEFARAIKSVGPAWSEMQGAVQQTLFKNAGDQFKALSEAYLPVMATGLKDVAGAANGAAQRISEMLTKSQALKGMKGIFAGSATATQSLGKGFANAVPGVLQLTGASTILFGKLTGGFGAAGTRFSEWVNKIVSDGSFEEWTRKGLAALGEIGSVLGSLGSIFGGVFSAAQAAGGSTLTMLSEGLKGVADTVNGPAFQGGLTTFFSGMLSGFRSLSAAAGPAVANMFTVLATELGTLASDIGPTVGKAFGHIATAISALLPVAGTIIRALAPVVEIIAGALSGAIQTLAPHIATVANALGPALTRVFSMLAPVIQQVATQLGPIISMLGTAFASVISSLAPHLAAVGGAFAGLVAAVRPLLAMILPVLVPALKFLGTILLGAVKGAIEGVTQVIRGVTQVLGGIVTFIKGVFTGNWSQAWAGLKQVAAGVFNTIVGVIKTWLNVTIVGVFRGGLLKIASFWRGGLNSLKKTATNVWNAIKGAFTGAISGIRNAVSTGINFVRNVFATQMRRTSSTATAVWNTIKTAFSTALNAIRNFVSNAFSKVRSIVSGAMTKVKTAVSDAIGKVVAKVKGLSGKVKGALVGFGTLLYDKGKALIQGLIDGIKDMLKPLEAMGEKAAKKLADLWPGSPVKAGPLKSWNYGNGVSGAGRKLSAGLAAGLNSQIGTIERAATRAASAAMPKGFNQVVTAAGTRPILPDRTASVPRGTSSAAAPVQHLTTANITLNGIRLEEAIEQANRVAREAALSRRRT